MPRTPTIMLDAAPSVLGVMLFLGLVSAPARAQIMGDPQQPQAETTPQTDSQIIAALIAQLDAEDWLSRDLATIELGELDPGITLEMLESYLALEGLSMEQRSRLELACLRRFALRPKGALGVSFGTIRVGAIEVQPIPESDEFPASKVLRPGDQIAIVGDRVIDGSLSLRIEILSRDPGQTLPVTILRGEEVLHFDLPLGSFGDLTGAVRMDPEMLSSALALRWSRLGIGQHHEKSIGEGITLNDWANAAFPQGEQPDARDPDLHAPRGWVNGPGVSVEIGSNAWARSSIDVWSDPATLRDMSQQRELLLAGEKIQPLVALRLLIERERSQIIGQLEEADDSVRGAMIEYLDTLTSKLDTITRELELLRPTTTQP